MLEESDISVENELTNHFQIFKWTNQVFRITTPYRLACHRIFFVESGSGNIQIDNDVFAVCDHGLFLLSKGQIYNFSEDSSITGFEISFDDFFWEKSPASANNCKAILFDDASQIQLLPLKEADFGELNFFLTLLYKEYLKPGYINKPDALAAFLKIIMIKMANVNALLVGFDHYEKHVYRKFIELVKMQCRFSHEVADYADKLDVPPRKLSDLCKRCSGKGAKELINDQLIVEAKRSLRFSSNQVKEIAFDLNFSTPEQFSHFFKKNAQISPQDYRKRLVNIDR
ncbi:helix-turn-helix domain-containing protein [Mucilaginibacter sp.]